MAEYRAIRVEKGNGGFGGPLTIQGTEKKNKVMYITGGGIAPEILPRIVELSGLEPVNGFKTSAPEDELALVIIDCGGTLRCGLYPKKRIPTININPVGKAGPLAQFIKEVLTELPLMLPPQLKPKQRLRRKREASTRPRSCPSRWLSPARATPWQRSALAQERSSRPSTRRHATPSRPRSTPCSPSWHSSPC